MLTAANKLVIIFSLTFVFYFFSSLNSSVAFSASRCCKAVDNTCGAAASQEPLDCGSCQDKELKKSLSCGQDNACPTGANCSNCEYGYVPVPCSGNSGGTPASCTQSVYALTNPTNLKIGEVKDFYADGRATNGIFSRMVATVTNSPAGTPAVGTVATTSGPTCYANGNCRQGFRLTAKNNGTALIKVTSYVRLCPACGETGSCSQTYTLNVGNVTPLQCKPGAKCVSDTSTYKVGSNVTCSMPVLTATDLAGGTGSYYSECTPYKGTVAQTKVAKSSTTGTFTAYKIPTGVTNLKCSFRHCVRSTTGATTCTNWGAAS